MGAFDKVIAGQPLKIHAQAWNAMLDAAQAHRGSQHRQAGRPQPAGGGDNTILVRNQAFEDLDRFQVGVLHAPTIKPHEHAEEFYAHPCMNLKLPSQYPTLRDIAILQEPIPAWGIGRAAVTGLCLARVHYQDPAVMPHHTYKWAVLSPQQDRLEAVNYSVSIYPTPPTHPLAPQPDPPVVEMVWSQPYAEREDPSYGMNLVRILPRCQLPHTVMPFVAQITGWKLWEEVYGGHVYKYRWKERSYYEYEDGSYAMENVPWPPYHREGSWEWNTHALNLIELTNAGDDSTKGHSVKVNGPHYPAGYMMQPVGGKKNYPAQTEGEGSQPYVLMYPVPIYTESGGVGSFTGAVRYMFQYENADDDPT